MSGLDPGNQAVLVGVARALGLKDASALADLRPSGLMKLTQRELLDIARELGLTRVSRLNKEALLARVWEALDLGQQPARRPRRSRPVASGRIAPGQRPSVRSPPPRARDRPRRAPTHRRHASWCRRPPGVARQRAGRGPQVRRGRGRGTRPGAGRAPRPRRTFPGATAGTGSRRCRSIPTACASTGRSPTTASPAPGPGLGAGGPGAWLALRVYDVTGRIFDGRTPTATSTTTWGATTASGSSTSASPPRRPSSTSA